MPLSRMVSPYATTASRGSRNTGTENAHTGYEHARTLQRGDQAPDHRAAHLPQQRELPASDTLAPVEIHENWLEANCYLNMNDLKEIKKAEIRQAA
jgi:hypothetical protein